MNKNHSDSKYPCLYGTD